MDSSSREARGDWPLTARQSWSDRQGANASPDKGHRTFNRTENVRPNAPSDPDFKEIYGNG
jgi:hypothetical protein